MSANHNSVTSWNMKNAKGNPFLYTFLYFDSYKGNQAQEEI